MLSGRRRASSSPTAPQSCSDERVALHARARRRRSRGSRRSPGSSSRSAEACPSSEAGQVGGHAAGALEEPVPLERGRGHPVHVEHGGVAGDAPVHLQAADALASLLDLHGPPSYQGRSLPPMPARPDRRRLRAIRDRLRREYGRPVLRPHHRPVDELVLTVLSQNTNDRNRDVAYGRLRERFGSWEDVRVAPVAEVEEAIRPGGLAPTKAVRIVNILRAIAARRAAGRRRPGLARRRAAARGPRVPVRPARRGSQDGGLRAPLLVRPPRRAGGHPRVPRGHPARAVPARAPLEEAHDEMLRLTPEGDAYEVHMLLIRHGRRTCVARSPRCGECPLLRMCPEGRRRRAAA